MEEFKSVYKFANVNYIVIHIITLTHNSIELIIIIIIITIIIITITNILNIYIYILYYYTIILSYKLSSGLSFFGLTYLTLVWFGLI